MSLTAYQNTVKTSRAFSIIDRVPWLTKKGEVLSCKSFISITDPTTKIKLPGEKMYEITFSDNWRMKFASVSINIGTWNEYKEFLDKENFRLSEMTWVYMYLRKIQVEATKFRLLGSTTELADVHPATFLDRNAES